MAPELPCYSGAMLFKNTKIFVLLFTLIASTLIGTPRGDSEETVVETTKLASNLYKLRIGVVNADGYYYARWEELALPVLRVKFDDPAQTWLYIDPRRARSRRDSNEGAVGTGGCTMGSTASISPGCSGDDLFGMSSSSHSCSVGSDSPSPEPSWVGAISHLARKTAKKSVVEVRL
jgi:hypothetical protein